ncbi:carboxypeptidase-like regulatory domain-containing protein [Microbacterium sp. DT81.1]|uniref:carboxypeptidase-like regulatory domain-containing protein n=1 Tax=Microbacterium sp. DT81.1 TaxID=3393413 RepID=UPI003CEE71A8
MAPNPESGDDFARALDPVRQWARAVADLPVIHDFDDEHEGDGAVLLRPLELEAAPASGPDRRYISSAELSLGVLVTTVGLPVFEAAGITSGLALSARSDGEWPMDASGPSLGLWRALARPPAPAFILRVPVRRILDRPAAPLVREPLHTVPVHMRVVNGRVVASDGRPLAAARVAFTDSGAWVMSDHRGRFRLPVATVEGGPLVLSIRARGISVTATVDAPSADAGGNVGDLTLPVPESD